MHVHSRLARFLKNVHITYLEWARPGSVLKTGIGIAKPSPMVSCIDWQEEPRALNEEKLVDL
ncbi:hypothetical protein CH75_24145 [Dyella jiangningensis]|nr:hypothetical protein CH75_01065 [Dyella jiangningensis]AHX16506.1 hypothetical protein CH75_24145 [Dyella jiangningensis]